jgi:hypothetical protein
MVKTGVFVMNRECDDASGGSASANMPNSDTSGTGTPGTDWTAGEHGALIRRARAILDGTLASVDLAVLIDSAQAGSAQASRQAAPSSRSNAPRSPASRGWPESAASPCATTIRWPRARCAR